MSEQTPSSQSKTMSRRFFLKLMGVGALNAILEGCGVKPPKSPSPEPPTRDSTHVAESSTPKEKLIYQESGVRVWADNQNIPTKWQSSSGQEGIFDKQALLEAQQKAQEKQGFKVAAAVRIRGEEKFPPATTSVLENAITKPPKDIVDPEELERRGIRVIASPKTDLHIRKAAFLPDGLLAHHPENSNHRLTIILTDSPTLVQEAFGDHRYDPFRSVIKENFPDMASIRKTAIEQETGDPDTDEIASLIRSQVTDKEAVRWGLYGFTGYTTLGSKNTDGSTDRHIFLPISRHEARPESLPVIVVEASATAFNVRLNQFSPADFSQSPKIYEMDPSQSYTPPDNYPLLEIHPEGTIEWKLEAAIDPASKSPYYVAAHELVHDQKYTFLEALDKQPDSRERLSFFSEQETDLATLEIIRKAYNQYHENGDDSAYPFALENKDEGYFVIG